MGLLGWAACTLELVKYGFQCAPGLTGPQEAKCTSSSVFM